MNDLVVSFVEGTDKKGSPTTVPAMNFAYWGPLYLSPKGDHAVKTHLNMCLGFSIKLKEPILPDEAVAIKSPWCIKDAILQRGEWSKALSSMFTDQQKKRFLAF